MCGALVLSVWSIYNAGFSVYVKGRGMVMVFVRCGFVAAVQAQLLYLVPRSVFVRREGENNDVFSPFAAQLLLW